MSFAKALQQVRGVAMEDKVFFRPKSVGSAVVGIVAGFSSYPTKATAQEPSRMVKTLKLKSALEFLPDGNSGATKQHLAIVVEMNHDLQSKIDSDTVEVGTYLLIEFLETVVDFNNMRRYRVEMISKAQYMELLRAESEHHANG
jgi:tellurite resistance protein